MKALLSGALVLPLLAGCGDLPGVPADLPACHEVGVVQTSEGPLSGVDAGRTCAFVGVPYAQSPIGDRRWRPPQPPDPRPLGYSADRFGSVCPQLRDGLAIGNENCLKLNIWAPGGRERDLPVLVFFHGGGNVVGSASERLYEGLELAARAGVVLVTVDFRLGVFGYLAHPALTAESEQHSSGNYGLLDQIAALEWIKKNVAGFGGDPGRVTVFGQSAGSRNLCALLTSPLAADLFQGAGLHSGACNLDSLASHEAVGVAVSEELGCEGAAAPLACLRGLAPGLIHAHPSLPDALTASDYNPNIDGWVVPDAPLALVARGLHHRMPILIGSNRDEVRHVLPRPTNSTRYETVVRTLYGGLAPAVLEQYPAASFSSPTEALVNLVGDHRYHCPARHRARVFAAAQDEPVYRFLFAGQLSGELGSLGAYHALELAFLFRTFDAFAADLGVSEYRPGAAELTLSSQFIGDYASFSATGAPERWRAYRRSDERPNVLGTLTTDAVAGSARCDFWDGLDATNPGSP